MPSRRPGITARFDRRAAESLGLELRMLAEAHGLSVARVEVTAPKRTRKAPRARLPGASAGGSTTSLSVRETGDQGVSSP